MLLNVYILQYTIIMTMIDTLKIYTACHSVLTQHVACRPAWGVAEVCEEAPHCGGGGGRSDQLQVQGPGRHPTHHHLVSGCV